MKRTLVLLVGLLLAGCSSPSDSASTDATASTTTPPVVANVTKAPPLPPPLTVDCDVVRSNVGTPVGAGVYADRFLGEPGCFFDDLFPDHAWSRSALIEIEWTAQPGMTGADVWFESDNCQVSPTQTCGLPQATSPTAPLSVKLEGDDFGDNIDAHLQVQVACQGAAYQQPFKVHVTLFANATVDEGFSALA